LKVKSMALCRKVVRAGLSSCFVDCSFLSGRRGAARLSRTYSSGWKPRPPNAALVSNVALSPSNTRGQHAQPALAREETLSLEEWPKFEPKQTVKIESVEKLSESRLLEVSWANGETSKYPYVWLRDNCRCPICFHPSVLARSFYTLDLNLNCTVKDILVDDEKEQMTIIWDDDHESPYDLTWLYHRSLNETGRKYYKEWARKDRKHFRADHEIQRLNFDSVINDDVALYKWISALETDGIVLIEGAPGEHESLKKIGDRVAFLRDSHYGIYLVVKNKIEPANLAYTSEKLDLHIDYPFNEQVRGVQMLMCIKQAGEGGKSVFSDGMNAAAQLQREFPYYYKLLTTTPVNFVDIGIDNYEFMHMASHPLIKLNPLSGEMEQILYGQPSRDALQPWDVEEVEPMYRAIQKFYGMLYDPNNAYRIKLKPGDIVSFDNFRVLHGRDAYRLQEGEERHLVDSYVDWDDLLSRRRRLQMKFGKEF